jgi:lysyl-tRNA synthetase class 2
MNVTAVQSSTLASIAYDSTRELLQLEFNSRAVYQYWGVPVSVHEALLRAPSKGSYFNQTIRGRFPYSRISHAAQTVAERDMPAQGQR